MPTIPQPPDRFGDELVELREIAGWDIPEVLIAHQDDPDLHRRLGLAKAPTGAQLGREVEQAERERLSGSSVKLAIVEPGGNDCRGRVEVDEIDWERGAATLRVWVGAAGSRSGLRAARCRDCLRVAACRRSGSSI